MVGQKGARKGGKLKIFYPLLQNIGLMAECIHIFMKIIMFKKLQGESF
jgi:hypothetical protein